MTPSIEWTNSWTNFNDNELDEFLSALQHEHNAPLPPVDSTGCAAAPNYSPMFYQGSNSHSFASLSSSPSAGEGYGSGGDWMSVDVATGRMVGVDRVVRQQRQYMDLAGILFPICSRHPHTFY